MKYKIIAIGSVVWINAIFISVMLLAMRDITGAIERALILLVGVGADVFFTTIIILQYRECRVKNDKTKTN